MIINDPDLCAGCEVHGISPHGSPMGVYGRRAGVPLCRPCWHATLEFPFVSTELHENEDGKDESGKKNHGTLRAFPERRSDHLASPAPGDRAGALIYREGVPLLGLGTLEEPSPGVLVLRDPAPVRIRERVPEMLPEALP